MSLSTVDGLTSPVRFPPCAWYSTIWSAGCSPDQECDEFRHHSRSTPHDDRTNRPRYGDATATAPAWEDVERLLDEAQLYWIITVRADDRPHAVPLVGVWHHGAFAFCTGPDEQKQRNLDAHPQVAVTTGTTGAGRWNAGLETIVEGTATRVTDENGLRALAAAWYAKYGDDWRFAVRGQEFVEESNSGGSTQGGAWVYRVEPAKVIVFGGDHGQTTYRP